MLTIKCAKCKAKLFKYRKIGKGKVIKCHKDRITRSYEVKVWGDEYRCSCGNVIGMSEDSAIKMKDSEFVYTGRKE